MLLCIDYVEFAGRGLTQMLCNNLRLPIAWHSYPVDPTGYDLAVIEWQPYGPAMIDRCIKTDTRFVVVSWCPEDIDRKKMPKETTVIDRNGSPQEIIDAVKKVLRK